MSIDARAITPNTYARRLGCGIHKILNFIRSGQLRAINIAADTAKRAQWVIPPDAIIEFERRRSAQPKAPTPRRRKKKPDVIEFF